MRRNFEGEDRGKRVVTADGDIVGTITDVDGERAFVAPDASLPSDIRQRLGVDEGETYELETSQVDAATNDTVRLTD